MAEVNQGLGAARAALGQGLGMGWGDEAEAWLRSKLGQGSYEDLLKQIRGEYAQYSKEHPYVSGGLEFAGGVAPGVAAMFVPGGQAAGATQLARTGTSLMARMAASPLARSIAAGTTAGAISGAGTAEEGKRVEGATGGGALGAALGLATPVALRAGKGSYDWLRERLLPTEEIYQKAAAAKLTKAMQESGITPQDIEAKMARDRAMGVPSTVANVEPAMADLAEAVAQRTGPGARLVEKTLGEQKLGSRERVYQKTHAALKPVNYYEEEQRLVDDLRSKAQGIYDTAFATGMVDDPVVNRILQHPIFQDAYQRGKKIADTQALAAKLKGEDPSRFQLPELMRPSGKMDPVTNQPVMELTQLPDVRTLDYVKRGLDDIIDAGYRGQSSVGKGQVSALRDLRNMFVGAIDRATTPPGGVSPYAIARKTYAGDMEVLDALRSGMKDFGKLDHEEVMRRVADMSMAEKEAFKTGVARDLYSKIMDPSGNFNAAQRIIGSPEMQAKLQPLFNSPAEFDLVKSALERESQLFHQSNKILGGSQTGKRMQMREELEAGSPFGEAIASSVTGGFKAGLTGTVLNALRSGTMTENTAGKLANMLMSKDPNEVAATVRLLDDYATRVAPRASAMQKGIEGGATTGLTASMNVPPPKEEGEKLEQSQVPTAIPGPDIEADLEAELARKK